MSVSMDIVNECVMMLPGWKKIPCYTINKGKDATEKTIFIVI